MKYLLQDNWHLIWLLQDNLQCSRIDTNHLCEPNKAKAIADTLKNQMKENMRKNPETPFGNIVRAVTCSENEDVAPYHFWARKWQSSGDDERPNQDVHHEDESLSQSQEGPQDESSEIPEDNDDTSFDCYACGKTFSSDHALNNHIELKDAYSSERITQNLRNVDFEEDSEEEYCPNEDSSSPIEVLKKRKVYKK